MIPASPWVCAAYGKNSAHWSASLIWRGSGRHSRLLAEAGYSVLAVDQNADALAGLSGVQGVKAVQHDLEERFGRLVMSYFLALSSPTTCGDHVCQICLISWQVVVVIYQTFMLGNEAYGKPSNPDFCCVPASYGSILLRPGCVSWLLKRALWPAPSPQMVQSICAVRD